MREEGKVKIRSGRRTCVLQDADQFCSNIIPTVIFSLLCNQVTCH